MTTISMGMITFRPHYEEWDQMDIENKINVFVDKFCKKQFSKFILSFESGTQDFINHFHLYFELNESIRFDKFKDKVYRFLTSKYDITSFRDKNRCLNYTNITSTHFQKYYMGYVLKEQHKKIINLGKEVFNIQDLISYYETTLENKTVGKQKVSINKKNVNIFVYNFLQQFPDLQSKEHYDISSVSSIFDRMLEKDYYMGVLSQRELLYITRLTVSYLNFKYFNISSSHFYNTIIKEEEREQLFN